MNNEMRKTDPVDPENCRRVLMCGDTIMASCHCNEHADAILHHFNAYEAMAPKYEAMVALLKECHENRLTYWGNSKSLVDDLLAIAEPKVLKIGDVVPAGEVPVGVKVEIKGTVGAKTRRKSVNDNETLACFDCELCGIHGTRLIATNAECTIVELPEKG